MELKPLEISDYPLFMKYYEKTNYICYNTSFVTMHMWNHEYNVHYYADEDFLVTLCHYEHLLFWNMPLCERRHFKKAVEFMREYSEEHGLPCYIDGVVNEVCDWLEEDFPGYFKIVKQRGEYDYIYEREPLQTLAGKKMQKRRNHYNTFVKNYEYTYRPLKQSDTGEIMDLLARWEKDKDDDPNIIVEKQGIYSLLKEKHVLPWEGGCIEINGKIEAFIIGSMLHQDTLEIHVEKANKAYRGLYVAILKHFLEHNFPEAKYVNREDDMGLPNLRQTKMNLHPAYLLEKSFAYPNQVTVRQARAGDLSVLENRWRTSFKEDNEDYIKYYFTKIFNPETTYVTEIDKMIVSVAHFRPVLLKDGKQTKKFYYIEGVSTHFMFQRQGYMKMLMEKALRELSCDGFLLQAYDWSVYDFLDFEDYTYKSKVTYAGAENNDIAYIDNHKSFDPDHLLSLYNQYITTKNGCEIRDRQYYAERLELMPSQDEGVLYQADGYLFMK